MARIRITTYTRTIPAAPAQPAAWWDKTAGATVEKKKTLAGPKALVRAVATSGKTEYIVFEQFRNNAAMTAYDADAAVIAVKAEINSYNTSHSITKSEVVATI
jgi:hypothetical protein